MSKREIEQAFSFHLRGGKPAGWIKASDIRSRSQFLSLCPWFTDESRQINVEWTVAHTRRPRNNTGDRRVFVAGYFRKSQPTKRGPLSASSTRMTLNESRIHKLAKNAIKNEIQGRLDRGEGLSIWYKDKNLTGRNIEIPLLKCITKVQTEGAVTFGDKKYRVDVLLSNERNETPVAAIEVIHKNHLGAQKVADLAALGIPVVAVMLSDIINDQHGNLREIETTAEEISEDGWARRILEATTLDHQHGFRPTFLFVPPIFHILYCKRLMEVWEWYIAFPGENGVSRTLGINDKIKKERKRFRLRSKTIHAEIRKPTHPREFIITEYSGLGQFQTEFLKVNNKMFGRIFIKPQKNPEGPRDYLNDEEFLFLVSLSRLLALEAGDSYQAIAPGGETYSNEGRFWCDLETGERFVPVVLALPGDSLGIDPDPSIKYRTREEILHHREMKRDAEERQREWKAKMEARKQNRPASQ